MTNQPARKTVAIIAARGGSKRLPRKNVLPLAGRPMIGYSIEAAKKCQLINRTIVSTDNEEIASVAKALGAEVFLRASELATDTATSESVVLDVLIKLKAEGQVFDDLVLLQPTSPLRTHRHLTECIQMANKYGALSSLSVVASHLHPSRFFTIGNGQLEPYEGLEKLRMPSAQLAQAYRPNGAIYFVSVGEFLKNRAFFIEPSVPFIMSAEDSVDVDTQDDFDLCELILKRRRGQA